MKELIKNYQETLDREVIKNYFESLYQKIEDYWNDKYDTILIKEELINWCYDKALRHKLDNKGNPDNYYITTMMCYVRQAYRKCKNMAELQERYAKMKDSSIQK